MANDQQDGGIKLDINSGKDEVREILSMGPHNTFVPNGQYESYDKLIRLIWRDLNSRASHAANPIYTKEQVVKFLANPYRNEVELIKSVRYIYSISTHFRRLIQYFTSLSDFSYVITPHNINTEKVNEKTFKNNYKKTQDLLSLIEPRVKFPIILTTCLMEDVFYGTFWVTKDDVALQRLPSSHCKINSIEGGVCNVSFDFSYFDRNLELLEYYPPEFKKKYTQYKYDKVKWVELDSPNSFAVKYNMETLDYAMPPFAGLLREIYDIEDYKQMRLARTEVDNYAMVAMKIPLTDDGNWGIDLDKARAFWSNLDGVTPPEVGTVLTPMDLEAIRFDRSGQGELDNIHNAEQSLFTSAGVSSLLFNNEKASANALALSIKVDQAMTHSIVKNIEAVVNRLLQSMNYGKNFKVQFLDVSMFNRKEAGDAYLKACQYGIPMVSYYCASQGLTQADMESLNFLENDILNIKETFVPLRSSTNTSSEDLDSMAPTDEGGRPPLEADEISESGEQNQEDA